MSKLTTDPSYLREGIELIHDEIADILYRIACSDEDHPSGIEELYHDLDDAYMRRDFLLETLFSVTG